MPENMNKNSSEKLANIRELMSEEGIDAYLVPREDEWQGEYVPERAQRLFWSTGFSGSAGMAVIATHKAAVFSDSRYSLQLEQQLAGTPYEGITTDSLAKKTPHDWIAGNLEEGMVVGYDPRLHTVTSILSLSKALSAYGISLKAIEGNLVDKVWDNQPDHPDAKVTVFPDKLAGKSSAEKRNIVADIVKEKGADAAFIAAPDSIAWLLNIRGDDVPHVPVVLSYALLHDDGNVDWFVPADKAGQDVRDALGADVRIHELDDVGAVMERLFDGSTADKPKIIMDGENVAIAFKTMAETIGFDVGNSEDVCQAPKAEKNKAEIEGIKQSHIVDGVAVTRLIKWLEEEGVKGRISELDVVEQLLTFRKMSPDFKDDSFDTISGWADNGAIVHYHATPEKHSDIRGSGLLLVDSGGQYWGEDFAGTTDITRTVAIGTPTQEMRESFTRVLKGHIAIASLRFPQGTNGAAIDVMARSSLWKEDLDYGHGTGHGVGAYLSVHEAGTGLSSRANKEYKPGMFLSNEPGYYKKDEYGIRIENLILVEEDGKNKATDRLMMAFNTVSYAPIDKNLIVTDMLNDDELDWLNDYHQQVYDNLSPHMTADELDWLKEATQPLYKTAPSPHAASKI